MDSITTSYEIVEVNSVDLNTAEIITNETILLSTENISFVDVGTQGPRGPTGLSSGLFNAVAGEDLGGHRCVYLSAGLVYYANSSDVTKVNRLVGITTGAVSLGSSVDIMNAGELTGFTGLVPDNIMYLQSNGTISPSIPLTGFIQQVGIALTDTKCLINIQPSILIG